MNFLYSIFALAIVLGIIVLVHEWGHYIAARLMKVRVETFSFGFGKRLFGKKVGDTDFRLSLIPLGGYVKMAGEEEASPEAKPDEFQSKNRAQKIFILLMGPFMNLVLAFFILTVINLTGVEELQYRFEPPRIGHVSAGTAVEKADLKANDLILSFDGMKVSTWKELEVLVASSPGETVKVEFERDGQTMETDLTVMKDKKKKFGVAGFLWVQDTRIGDIVKNTPASQAGLKYGDRILAIDGQKISSFYEFQKIVAGSGGKSLSFDISRDNDVFSVNIVPEDIDGRGVVGLFPAIPMKMVKYPFFESMSQSLKEISRLTTLIFVSLRKMIVGKLSPENLSGPIDIASISRKAMFSGISSFFLLIAFISLNLGLVNLFPIPVLDGGHLLIFTIESIIRRDFNQKVKNILMNLGFMILIALMAFVILNDVAKQLPNGWKSMIPFL